MQGFAACLALVHAVACPKISIADVRWHTISMSFVAMLPEARLADKSQ